jgi:L-rhamnose mutarotase
MKRYGWVIGVRPEKLEEYKRLHAAVWPGVLKMIKACNIQNFCAGMVKRGRPDGSSLPTNVFGKVAC